MKWKDPATSFKVRDHPLRVDLRTPEQKPGLGRPVFIRRFRAAAQPLLFLDYLISNPVKGAVVNGGGILVKRIRKALSSTSSPHTAIFERTKTFLKKLGATGFASFDPPER
jgi:hypothetical protein